MAVGVDDSDIFVAVTEVEANGGGLAVVEDGCVVASLPLPLDGAKRTKKEEVLCNFNDIFYYQLFVTNNTTIIHSPAASLSAFSFKAFTPANGNNRRDLSKNFDAFAYSPFDKNTCKYKLTIVKVLNYVESFHTHLRHVTTLFGFTLVSNTSSLNN